MDYTINLMWVNKNYGKFCTHNIIKTIEKWTLLNPGVVVNFWFDSLLVKNNTIVPLSCNVIDIRSLKQVNKYPELFNMEIPVYFRVDLLRIIATVEFLQSNTHKYFVYADVDIQPMNYNELFDTDTINNLHTFGIVLAKSSHNIYENSFHIVANDPSVLHALQVILIDLSIQRFKHQESYFLSSIFHRLTTSYNHKIQCVYHNYIVMLKYLLSLKNFGKLYIVPDIDDMHYDNYILDDEIYQYDKHGLKYFGMSCSTFGLSGKLFYAPNKPYVLPTKFVLMPVVKGYYNNTTWYHTILFNINSFLVALREKDFVASQLRSLFFSDAS